MNSPKWYPSTISARPEWNENFYLKMPGYAVLLNLPPAHVDACVASLKYANYVLSSWLTAVREFGPASTSAVELLLFGSGPDAVVLSTFAAPALPPGVASVPPGVLVRLFALIQLIKASPGYTEIIGHDLGIIASEQAGPDLATVKPGFTLETTGGHVMVKWGWQGIRKFVGSLEIEVNRGTGFAFLTMDTTPGYLDTEPLPATAAAWTYRAIWRDGDARVGQWSNPVSITVGG